LLKPDPAEENTKHKLKKLVQKPNSYFIDIKCSSGTCKEMVHTFVNAQSVIKCKKCSQILATPTGGKLSLKDGVHIRRKAD